MSLPDITEIKQYLTFKLDQETYALDIIQVSEVLDFSEITKVPCMPDYMRGVINLRGGAVPVIDMRLKFGMARTEMTADTCIIILELDMEGEDTIVGALTDSVKEVITMGPDQILPPPKMSEHLNTTFIKGMVKKNDEFIIIIDIDNIFTLDNVAITKSLRKQGFQTI